MLLQLHIQIWSSPQAEGQHMRSAVQSTEETRKGVQAVLLMLAVLKFFFWRARQSLTARQSCPLWRQESDRDDMYD